MKALLLGNQFQSKCLRLLIKIVLILSIPYEFVWNTAYGVAVRSLFWQHISADYPVHPGMYVPIGFLLLAAQAFIILVPGIYFSWRVQQMSDTTSSTRFAILSVIFSIGVLYLVVPVYAYELLVLLGGLPVLYDNYLLGPTCALSILFLIAAPHFNRSYSQHDMAARYQFSPSFSQMVHESVLSKGNIISSAVLMVPFSILYYQMHQTSASLLSVSLGSLSASYNLLTLFTIAGRDQISAVSFMRMSISFPSSPLFAILFYTFILKFAYDAIRYRTGQCDRRCYYVSMLLSMTTIILFGAISVLMLQNAPIQFGIIIPIFLLQILLHFWSRTWTLESEYEAAHDASYVRLHLEHSEEGYEERVVIPIRYMVISFIREKILKRKDE